MTSTTRLREGEEALSYRLERALDELDRARDEIRELRVALRHIKAIAIEEVGK